MEKIIEFNLYKYGLPLKTALNIKNHQITKRSGIIINIKTSSGFSSFGEIAPLPFFHKESLSQAFLQIKEIRKDILNKEIRGKAISDIKGGSKLPQMEILTGMVIDKGIFNFNLCNYFSDGFNFLKNIFSDFGVFPSVKFGIEMALLNLYFLNPDFEINLKSTMGTALPVCRLLMDLKSDTSSEIEKIIKSGYKAIKIKVGREPAEQEISRIKKIKQLISEKSGNEIKLRLDSNGLWNLAEAVYFGNQIGNDAIEYIEDPVNDINEYKLFFKETGIPIALDEKLYDFIDINNIDKANFNDLSYLKAFIIKPDFVGGFLRASELITIAKENGIMPVLSNSFDSSLAISSIALFAGLMNLTKIPIGLDTLSCFRENLSKEDIKTAEGKINLMEVLNNINKINFNLLEPADF